MCGRLRIWLILRHQRASDGMSFSPGLPAGPFGFSVGHHLAAPGSYDCEANYWNWQQVVLAASPCRVRGLEYCEAGLLLHDGG